MGAIKLKDSVAYGLDLAALKRSSADVDPSVQKTCVFSEDEFKTCRDSAILLTNNLSAAQIIQLGTVKPTFHIIQNSLQPLAEKIEFINRLQPERDVFFSEDFQILKNAQVVECHFDLKKNRDSLIEDLFLKLNLNSQSSRANRLYQILNELIMNVQMDAFKRSKNNNQKNSLIKIEVSEKYIAVSLIDYFGSLDNLRLLTMVRRAYQVGFGQSIQYQSQGAGIGTSLVYSYCDSLIIGSRPKKVTRVSVVLPFKLSEQEMEYLQKSLHVI